jgi:sugar lactone lactonase YvrE
MTQRTRIAAAVLLLAAPPAWAAETDWPPPLKGAASGTVALTSPAFLDVPEAVAAEAAKEGAAPFVVAKAPPTVTLAYHRDLGPDAKGRRLWSSWGDICVARDGRVYCAVGDHGKDMEGDARCFIYRWDPKSKTLDQVVDMNQVVPPEAGRPSWSKVHAKIDEGADGKIYFSCTLNDGNKAKAGAWTEKVPGGQVYRYDPATGKTETFASLPPKRCTATSLYDPKRNVWWCNLEAGDGNALWGLDLATRKPVFQSPDGAVGFNRAFALAADGSVFFNGPDQAKPAPKAVTPAADPKGGAAPKPVRKKPPTKAELAEAAGKVVTPLMKYDPATGAVTKTGSTFTASPGMRSASAETRGGHIYGVTQGTGELYRYAVKDDRLTLLGKAWLTGAYVTGVAASPDDRFVYYLPGAHGQSYKHGTPVLQYEVATGTRKVLGFLIPPFEKEYGYAPGGTYGMKLSADGGTLYVNFNGNAVDGVQPAHAKTKGFGLTAFAAIAIPASER